MGDSKPQYVTIAEMWECRVCNVDGRHGKFGIMAHEILRHVLEWSS